MPRPSNADSGGPRPAPARAGSRGTPLRGGGVTSGGAGSGGARSARTPRRGRGIPRWLPSWKLLSALFALAVAFGVGLFAVGYAAAEIPDPNELASAQTTVVYFDDGQTELGRFSAQDRIVVPIEAIPAHVREAVLAAEDRSFYENSGVSPTGIARAFWNNLRGGPQQGGSTITQQYVKNYYLESDRTYARKLRELFIAIKIDREMGKDQILHDYLNTIYFGRGAYGIEMAARNYFGKPAAELSTAEGALIAGVIPSPGRYDPAADRDAAERRWNYVLDGMVELGSLSAAERLAQVFPETIDYEPRDTYGGPAGYLLTTVRQEILQRTRLTADDLDRGGLRIVTTFRVQAQNAALAAVNEVPLEGRPEQLRVALAALDPADGAVVAMYGGADYVARNANAATQDRAQAGSTFKPFALAAGLEDRVVSLRTRLDGDSDLWFEGYDRPVRNFDDKDAGRVNLVEATADSVNTAYVELNERVTPQRTVEAAVAAGIPSDSPAMEPFIGVVLGSTSVHPIDMAQAYATFAAQGVRYDRFTVRSITGPTGEVLYEAAVQSERVFQEDTMADLTVALRAVVRNGSGSYAGRLDRPAAGKTGTSSDARSAWFVGYTPQLAASVALYNEDNSEIQAFGGESRITGGGLPTRIWTAFMAGALQGQPVLDFPERADVGPAVVPRVEREPRRERETQRTRERSRDESEEPAPPEPARTQPPRSQAPVTEAPETEAPETEAPETEAPETEAPETEQPEVAPAPLEPTSPAPPTQTLNTDPPPVESEPTEAPADGDGGADADADADADAGGVGVGGIDDGGVGDVDGTVNG